MPCTQYLGLVRTQNDTIQSIPMKKTGLLFILFIILLSAMINGCQLPDPTSGATSELIFDEAGNPIPPPTLTNTPFPTYVGTPTPDAPHSTTGSQQQNSSFKIIPDSELIYGPRAQGFDVRRFVTQFENGRLLTYQETVEGHPLAGPEIVSLIAHRYSVNPRLLLAILEYRSGWVTQSSNPDTSYPVGYTNDSAAGLYKQLGWAANQLNWGYYGRSEGNLHSFAIGGETTIAYATDINDGTAGVQRMLGANPNATQASWHQDIGETGLFATFSRLFGNPFAYTVDSILPANLAQPPLQLPWADGETWYYTSGPHGGWAAGSAWAALDFAPEAEQNGCIQSDAWVRAMADGIVTRSGFGAVVIDLDGDGFAGTGWALTYMHLETRDRIPIGTVVQTGDKLGHPSCEGGFSSGTHVHVARTVNGRWVSADGTIPFQLGGWVSQGLGREYDGLLLQSGVSIEACACREENNAIQPQP